MGSSFYVLLDVEAGSTVSLSQILRDVAGTGYSVYESPFREAVCPPGEPPAPIRCTLYAGNYFRVFVADRVVEFYHEAVPSQEIVDADERLRYALLHAPGLRIRRWVRTEEGWDDEDRPFLRVLDEGDGPDRLAGL
jgi:hypothetical protein